MQSTLLSQSLGQALSRLHCMAPITCTIPLHRTDQVTYRWTLTGLQTLCQFSTVQIQTKYDVLCA